MIGYGTRWNPVADLLAMQRDMSDFITKAFRGADGSGSTTATGASWAPATEAFYKDNALVVRAWLPGVDPAKIDVQVTGAILTIKGERVFPYKLAGDGQVYSEIAYGRFERTLTLPENVGNDRVSAKYENGVLEISLPVHEGALPKKVPIEVAQPASAASSALVGAAR